jgi:hypothetical protein
MKASLLVACLSVSIVALAWAHPEIPPTPPDAPPPELARLQQELEKRRADALRPVEAWYRAQLEAMERKQTDLSPEAKAALTKALAAARAKVWEADQPELRQALLAAQWLWRSNDDAEGVATTFRADGSVHHIGMRGSWRITGPCEVTIQTEDREQFILRFNASLSAYAADRQNVSGVRMLAGQ